MQSSKFASSRHCLLLAMYSLLLSLLPFPGNAQDKDGAEKINSTANVQQEKGPSFLFDLQFGPVKNAAISSQQGSYILQAPPSFFVAAGVDFRTKLHQQLYLITGLKGGMFICNPFFDVPTAKLNRTGPTNPFERVTLPSVNFLASVPVLLEKPFRVKQKQTAFVLAGANLRYSFGYDSDAYGYSVIYANNETLEVLSLNLNANNHRKPWLNYNVGGGYDWALKNRNVLRIGLLANISTANFISGSYQINIPNEPTSTGTYRFSGTSIGLSVSYGFTGANKKYVQAYEKQNTSH